MLLEGEGSGWGCMGLSRFRQSRVTGVIGFFLEWMKGVVKECSRV